MPTLNPEAILRKRPPSETEESENKCPKPGEKEEEGANFVTFVSPSVPCNMIGNGECIVQNIIQISAIILRYDLCIVYQ